MSHTIHSIFIAVTRRLLDGLDRRSHQYEATNLLLDHYAVPYVRIYGADPTLSCMINDHMEKVFELDLAPRIGAREGLDPLEQLTYTLFRSVLLTKYADMEMSDALRATSVGTVSVDEWVLDTFARMRTVEDFAIICKNHQYRAGNVGTTPLGQWWSWRCAQNLQNLSLTGHNPQCNPLGSFSGMHGGYGFAGPAPVFGTPYAMNPQATYAQPRQNIYTPDTTGPARLGELPPELEKAVDMLVLLLESPAGQNLQRRNDGVSLMLQQPDESEFQRHYNQLFTYVEQCVNLPDYRHTLDVPVVIKGKLHFTWTGVLRQPQAVLSYGAKRSLADIVLPSHLRTERPPHVQAMGDLLSIMEDPRSVAIALGDEGLLLEQVDASDVFISNYSNTLRAATRRMLDFHRDMDVVLDTKFSTGRDLVYMWVMEGDRRNIQFYFENHLHSM